MHRYTPLRTAGKRSTELYDNISYINPIFKLKYTHTHTTYGVKVTPLTEHPEINNTIYRRKNKLTGESTTSATNTSAIFDVLLTVHLSTFISVINQLDAQFSFFTISLFHASTSFEHMFRAHVLETCRGME